jgi:hypothetical protein
MESDTIEVFDVKICILCNDIKPLEEFVLNGNYRKSCCKVCDNVRRGKHQKDNRAYYDVKQKEWRDNNLERNREIVGKAANRHYARVRQEAVEIVGKGVIACIQCGFDDIRAIQIDHINGGGLKDFKNSTSSTEYYKNMLIHPEKYQLLCANCNWIKRYTNNERCSKYGQ